MNDFFYLWKFIAWKWRTKGEINIFGSVAYGVYIAGVSEGG